MSTDDGETIHILIILKISGGKRLWLKLSTKPIEEAGDDEGQLSSVGGPDV